MNAGRTASEFPVTPTKSVTHVILTTQTRKAHTRDMTKSAKFVTATCACGNQFQREVKRGRPQVWCPSCQEIPYEQRVAKAAVQPAGDAAAGDAPATPAVKRPFDAYGYCRDQIEAEVAQVNAAWPARYAELVAGGRSPFDAGLVLADDLRAVYAKFKPVKADGFQDQEDQ